MHTAFHTDFIFPQDKQRKILEKPSTPQQLHGVKIDMDVLIFGFINKLE